MRSLFLYIDFKRFLLLMILVSPLIGQAQFPVLDWQYYTGAPAFGSAASADIDKDGFYEIVFTTYTNDGRAHCLNAEDGSVAWTVNIGGCGDVAPLIYDVDNDDTLDVIVNGSCNPTLFCINGITGVLKWSVPSGGGDSPPTAADLDNDGLPEILFCNFNGQLRIVNGEDGTTFKIIQVDPFGNAVQTEPTLVDVNNDNQLDIILANHFNINGLFIWAYDFMTEDTIWTNFAPATSTYNAYHGGAVADVDGDGLLEYVIGANNGLVRALNVEDGSVLWTDTILMSVMSPVSIADLDGNGDLEVVVTNNDWVTLDERIWVLDGLTGQIEWSYATTFSSFRGCAIADINGNDTLDLVAGYFMGDVIAVEPYSGLLWQTNVGQYLGTGLPYFAVDHGPLVADFDKSGTMDVFVVAGYGTYTPDSLNTGKAFMFSAGIGQCPEWLMFRQDAHRSGYLSQQEIDAACNTLFVAPSSSDVFPVSIYPNPSRDKVTVDGVGDLRISVYDLQGRCIFRSDMKNEKSDIDVSSWEPGLYTIGILSGRKSSFSKLLVYE